MNRSAALILGLIFLAGASQCQSTSSSIPNCSLKTYNNGFWYCTSCYSGYYLSSGRCYSCSLGCYSCSSSTVCNSCRSGYYLTAFNSCYSCTSGCSSCTDGITCNTCSSGYYLTSAKKCYSCIPNCSVCSNGTQCTSCNLTYQKKTISSTQDKCEATLGTVLLVILVFVGLILLIPCIICCCCWAAISQCLGWSTTTSTTYVETGPTYVSDFDHPPPPAYGHGMPPPPAYHNDFPPPPETKAPITQIW